MRWLLFLTLITLAVPAFALKLTSTDLDPAKPLANTFVYNQFGCTGENKSPALAWTKSKKAKSYAITVYDPDAPTGSGWWHWVVYDIPPTTLSLERGAKLPSTAKQATTDFGTKSYGGACPPAGDKPHRYIFSVYALNVATLPTQPNASPAMVGYFLNQHKIAVKRLTVKYGR